MLRIFCAGYKEEMLSKPLITRKLSESGQVRTTLF